MQRWAVTVAVPLVALAASCAEGTRDTDLSPAGTGSRSSGGSAGSIGIGGSSVSAGAGGAGASNSSGGGTGGSSSGGTGGIGGTGGGGFGGGTGGTGGTGTGGSGGGTGGTGGAATGGGGTGGSGGATTGGGGTGGGGSGDLWLEVTYTSNSTPTSPSWDNSDTPGWTLRDWATSNESWPEVWDPFQGMQTNLDPMGHWAVIIDGEHLQLMIGLQNLVSYTDATVRLEGRGYSTNSSARFNVYNPLNGCGVSATMAHDWSLHTVEVSIGDCLVPGGGVQAIRVDPTSQGLALHRMRLTIHGAVF